LNIVNQTGFTFAPLLGRINFPEYSLTFIVKGTFQLKCNHKAEIAEEQKFPTGDEFYEDDEDALGAPRYESDFAFFKPRTDLLLVGSCHTPRRQFMTSCPVRFQVGDSSKSLIITGDRYWEPSLLISKASQTIPFKTLPLRYEHSFGGEGFERNPIGKGYKKTRIRGREKLKPLPNIEYPTQRQMSSDQLTEPAGFGPLRRTWASRFGKLGHYKRNYVKKRWPWFTEDMDWTYFNAAPPEMQRPGYLVGDEKLSFKNLHPDHSAYTSELPGLRTRCFLTSDVVKEQSTEFREVTMNLDTLWVDMDNEHVVLVWRGWSSVRSEEFDEIKDIYIVSEDLHDSPHTIAYWREQFERAVSDEEVEMTEAEPELIEPDEETAEDVEVYQLLQWAEAKEREQLIAAGLDPDNLPPQSPEEQAFEAEILNAYGVSTEETEEFTITRDQVVEMHMRGESLAGKDLSELDLSNLDLRGINFEDAILINTKLDKAELGDANLRNANLSSASLKAVKLKNADLSDADFSGSDLSEANLINANIAGTLFEKSIMIHARMEQVHGIDTQFASTDLSSAFFEACDLEGADFSSCNLTSANFNGANLYQANFNGASGRGIAMEGAKINEIRVIEEADFTNGNFRHTIGHESIWENAKLVGTDFRYAQMSGADFTGADLAEANASFADLAQSNFSKADLKKAKFVLMNLFLGSLESADLSETDFNGSNLYGVEFYNVTIRNANFEGANLKMTKLA
jgi:uncharacterized protein YjbI with pentapeptide repeats